MSNRYGLNELPSSVREYIVNNATKRANWESPTEKGEKGSSMMMEWVTFALTPKEWLRQTEGFLNTVCPDDIRQELINLP